MIIGNGLIATAFKNHFVNNDIILFASGVSNSSTTSIDECTREKNLIESFIDSQNNSLFVYFSTCSIYDTTLKNSLYIQHKLQMESLIKSHYQNFLIIRLPIVVGPTKNSYTLINNLLTKIMQRENITIFQNACRYLIDIEDVVYWTKALIHEGYRKRIINLAFDNRTSIFHIVNLLESITNLQPTEKLTVNKGTCYTIDNSFFLSILETYNIIIPQNYNERVLVKYYGK